MNKPYLFGVQRCKSRGERSHVSSVGKEDTAYGRGLMNQMTLVTHPSPFRMVNEGITLISSPTSAVRTCAHRLLGAASMAQNAPRQKRLTCLRDSNRTSHQIQEKDKRSIRSWPPLSRSPARRTRRTERRHGTCARRALCQQREPPEPRGPGAV